jgi:hypothetical protein
MSTILWDPFAGSAPYREILSGALRPGFWVKLIRELIKSLFKPDSVGGASHTRIKIVR